MKHLYYSIKGISLFCLNALLIWGAASCADDYNKDTLKANTILSLITIDEKYETYTLAVGEEYLLHYTVKPDNATDRSLIWVSGNEEVATVDTDGRVKAKSVGETVITAKPNVGSPTGVTASIKIQVVEEIAYTREITIINPEEELSIMETQSLQLNTQTVPEKPSFYLLEWESSDETVAKVDENGVVLGIGEGNATITVKATDGTNKSHSVSVRVHGVIQITGFEIDKSHAELGKGEVSILKYTILPEDATVSALKWTSSDATIAAVEPQTVGSGFLIKGLAYGSATLTANVEYGDGTTFSKDFDVVVAEGKINDVFINGTYTNWVTNSGNTLKIEDDKLIIPLVGQENLGNKIKRSVLTEFYASKYSICAIKAGYPNLAPDAPKIPSLVFNIWDNRFRPRISVGMYGGKNYNIYRNSKVITKDGAYVTCVDFSGDGLGFTPDAYTIENYMVPAAEGKRPVLNDGTGLDQFELNFYDLYFTEATGNVIEVYWIKTFKNIEEYEAYMTEYEGAIFE